MEALRALSPFLQALLATLFTWGVTAAGAAAVLIFKQVKRGVMDMLLGAGAGVMLAACFWSLLSPAIELSAQMGRSAILAPALGLLCGGAFVMLADRLLCMLSLEKFAPSLTGGGAKRCLLLILSVTLHNIPEGIAVGVGFGVAALGVAGADFAGAVTLALGIGLQNFPEGAAVSLPLRREGMGRARAFFYGQLSGVVEPIGAALGVGAALLMRSALPFLLSFSAGTMLAVAAGELIPEAARCGKTASTAGVIVGFLVMMVLDVALG